MFKRRTIAAIPVILVLGLAAGCGSSPEGGAAQPPAVGHPYRVAVVDLDEVAKQTGLLQQLTRSVQKAGANLEQQLAAVQAKLQTQLEDKAKTVEKGPGTDSKARRELLALRDQLNAKLKQVEVKAQETLLAHRQQLIEQVRHLLHPIVKEVATESGIHVVLSAGPQNVFYRVPEADITQTVIDRVRKIQLTRQLASASPAASTAPSTAPSPAALATPAPTASASAEASTVERDQPASAAPGPAPAATPAPADRPSPGASAEN